MGKSLRRVAICRDPRSAQECRLRALKLLQIRSRSRNELEKALRIRGFAPGTMDATLSTLERSGLLNETAALETFIAARRNRFGLERLRRELRGRGFPEGAVRKALESISSVDEERLLRKLIELRRSALIRLSPDKKKKRIFDFLVRRGFPRSRVLEALGSDDAEASDTEGFE